MCNPYSVIYFEVKQYTPYKSAQFYKETEKYVICNVKPLHHGGTKRLAAMVMVKNRPSVSEIALYSNEIKEDILYADIYNNEIEEKRYNGKPTNIIFIYFGCDEADMSNSNYMYITTWIDENQDANHWYNMSDGSVVENGVHIKTNTGYDLIRKLNNEKVDNDEFMQKVKLITFEIISLSEQIINRYREFINGTISEVQLINELCTINKAMNTAYIKYSDLPVAPVELRDWAQMHDQLIGSAVDLSLFYSNEGAQKWSAENRRWLMEDSIKKYEEALEALKNVEK